jgi:hypothetical protein
MRTDGVTTAERYLKRLCDHSFLSMWSYPGLYRDQGRRDGRGHGKELCDLLVVFENHILIFSDKDCSFPNTGNLDLDWSRWYTRAVENSAKQVWGAERWIKEHPDRIYLDRACTQPFPIDLPDPSAAKFHRIVVAHDASARCKKELGGSGSLMIQPDIIGSKHCLPASKGGTHFAIGQIDPTKGFVHVLDDTSLDILMLNLSTISDFVSYLTKKERFILENPIEFSAAGEEELLAAYLRNLNDKGEHDFIIPGDVTHVAFLEGLWDEFLLTPQWQAQIKADKISYLWGDLIEKTTKHALERTQYWTTSRGIRDDEKILRFMAREPRVRRRMLARSLYQLVRDTPKEKFRAARVIKPTRPEEPCYVFLLLTRPDDKTEDEYRLVRRNLLVSYCYAAKIRFPELTDIVGFATETGFDIETRSEDVVYFNASGWTEEEQSEESRFAREFGLLEEIREYRNTTYEFPLDTLARMKGKDRNKPCLCGSGKKFKHCCLREGSLR